MDWLPGQVQVTRQPLMAALPAVTVTVAWKPLPQLLSTWKLAVQLFVPPVGVAVGGTMVLLGTTVGVGVGGTTVGVGPMPGATVMALILGFWVPLMNWITTWPLELAVVLKLREMARLEPPALA